MPVAADRPQDRDLGQPVRRREPQTLVHHLDRDGDQAPADVPGVLVVVPCKACLGAAQNRRRTRDALLAGLQARGHVPDGAGHVGLLAAFQGPDGGAGGIGSTPLADPLLPAR